MKRTIRGLISLAKWALRSPEFRRPTQADVLVFDAEMSELITPFLEGITFRILHQRDRQLNLSVLIRSLRRGFNLEQYLHEYARIVNPKVVVSLLDNETALYRLKAVVPNARVVAIQNGWRGITYDIFSLESSSRGSDLEADDVLVFGPAIGKRFESLVRTKTTPIGSFKSNLVPIHRAPGSRVIALVSTVRQKVDLDQYVPVRTGLSAVKYRQIFERRLELARLVYQFARREGFHLRVLGKDESIGREFEMYRHHLGTPDSSWSFTPRTTLLANYAEIDHAHAVISSSSTLGYEALGRGARSAFFMIDFEVLGDDGTQFGWPLELPKDGAFWTHSLEAVRIEEVLNNVALSTDLEWKVMSRDIAQELITFDSGNSLFARMMAQI